MILKLFDIKQEESISRIRDKKLNFIISRNKNIDNDYFATPPVIIEQLLIHEPMTGFIWEPACGEGHISECLKKHGLSVYSSDLIDRGYGDVVDFLNCDKTADIIITNPPFNLIDAFLRKAKAKAKAKVIFVCSTNFLNGKKRINTFLNDTNFPLTKIYLTDTKINFYKNGNKPKTRTGFMASCIVVFEKTTPPKTVGTVFLRV